MSATPMEKATDHFEKGKAYLQEGFGGNVYVEFKWAWGHIEDALDRNIDDVNAINMKNEINLIIQVRSLENFFRPEQVIKTVQAINNSGSFLRSEF